MLFKLLLNQKFVVSKFLSLDLWPFLNLASDQDHIFKNFVDLLDGLSLHVLLEEDREGHWEAVEQVDKLITKICLI